MLTQKQVDQFDRDGFLNGGRILDDAALAELSSELDRVIAIGPRAQGVLKLFFTPDINDYLFSPQRAVEELRAARSANRKTPRWPSHLDRNAAKRVKNCSS